MKTILIAAGGTGGHIFPALAITKELAKNYKIIWLGTENGMEQKLVKNYTIFNVSAVGIRGKKLKKLITAPFKILKAILQTRNIIKKQKVKCVIVMGGFVGGVGGLGSIIANVKFILHEQNTVAGTSNKWLNRWSYKSFQAFDNTLKNAITCGNPINWQPKNKTPVNNPINVLILGGSLGANAINQLIPKLKTEINIVHQTGVKHLESVKRLYNKPVKIVAFINDMASNYAWADVIICRAGAMTISEIIATKSVAILIPFPFAIDNHQLTNAKVLTDKKCGFLVEEKNLNAEKIDEILLGLSSEKINQIQEKISKISNKNPAIIIAQSLEHICQTIK